LHDTTAQFSTSLACKLRIRIVGLPETHTVHFLFF
jgi:hypothetical protein